MIVEVLVSSGISVVVGFFVAKKIDDAKYDVVLAQAQAKAKVIEHEAELLLKNAKNEVLEKELNIKKKYDEEISSIKNEYERKELFLEQKEKELNALIQEQINKDRALSREYKNLEKEKNYVMFGLLNNMKDEDLVTLATEIGTFEEKMKNSNK